MSVDERTASAGLDAGRRFAAALAGRQVAVLTGVLSPTIDFRGLTPGRSWEATSATEVIDILLDHWFEPTDVVDELLTVSTSTFADRQHLSYQIRGHNADGPFVVEQQAYYTMDDDDLGRIRWMRVLCSGFRPG
jgi:hypothetical protein